MKACRLQGVAGIALLLTSSFGQISEALAQTGATVPQTEAPQAAPAQTQTAPVKDNPAQSNPTAPAPPLPTQVDTTGRPGFPQAPEPNHPGPLYLRETAKDFTHLKGHWPNPFAPYTSTDFRAPRLTNTPRITDLLRDGKIYLSLSDAILLALENNYDIAIARINLDIADTDILRARSGTTLRGVSTGLITNTLGGTSTTVTGGGGPGGTSTSSGGSGTGASGLVLSTNGGGPTPLNRDGVLSGTIQYEQASSPVGSTFSGSGNLFTPTQTQSNSGSYQFQYQQGFVSGTSLNVSFTNARTTSTATSASYSPSYTSSFSVRATQQLLQGFGPGVQGRFVVQAKNNRRIADSAFRQQLIYTITQVESIYWNLVSAYEDVQAKQRALVQSTQLATDNRKQLQIGTLAPLDVVNSDQAVATDRQSLTTSESNLEYQQLLMKQAIVRDLNDPQLSAAPVIPTERVSLERMAEEDTPVEELVKQAYVNNPAIEQAALNMENNKITIRGQKNGLLPQLNAYAFYGGSGVTGQPNPNSLICQNNPNVANCGLTPGSYGQAFSNAFNNSAPDKGVGATLNITIRNRAAQADQARSQMEYRQAQMRLQQLYTQTRIQVINEQYALTNDRAAVLASQAARDYQAQALDAERKRYRLGASTSDNVLQQERNLATAENTLISSTAAYARDRATLLQLLSNTLERYGISIEQAASGVISTAPNVPGLMAPQPPAPPKPLTSTPPPLEPYNPNAAPLAAPSGQAAGTPRS